MGKEHIMKSEYMIGQKPKRIKILLKIVWVSIIFAFIYLLFTKMSEKNHLDVIEMSVLTGLKITFITGYILTVFSVLTSVALRQYLIIDHQEIRYFAADGFISRLCYTFNIITDKESKPLITIKIKEIAEMTLLYSHVTSSFYFKGHMLVYRFRLKDGTYVVIHPDSFHFRDQNIAEGIEYMQRSGVMINDPYDLLQGLKNPDIRFSEYVEKVVLNNEDHI